MKHFKISYILALSILFVAACQRTIDDLEPASFPANGEVFLDGFPGDLNYIAFGDSKVTAFEVDNRESYEGSASMRFEVPNINDPKGAYAGGAFVTSAGRDLSGFDALTFWARASQAINLDVIGYGNDLGEAKYQAVLNAVPLNTNWQKYYIPIPDPAKLTQERGMLFYAEVAENEAGYTFWIDEVKFEKLGTIEHPRPGILEGQDQETSAETGDKLDIGGFFVDFNLPTGVDQRVVPAPGYFAFTSSAPSIANVSERGQVMVVDSGSVVIRASMAGIQAAGSLRINSTGEAVKPPVPAPVPTIDPDSVISLFSDAYENETVDTWNTRWQFSTAEDTDIQVDGDNIKRYKNLNFVGIEFTSETKDISEMTHFHIDIWTPDPTDLPAAFKVLLVDFGPNNTFDGGDDSSHELAFTRPLLQSEQWVSIDVPLSSFTGLTGKKNLAQMVLSGDLPTVFIDNVYFYNSGQVINVGPQEAAPVPTRAAADVISVFSDSYTNLPGTDFTPNWGQATVVTQQQIQGNNTLVYSGLNYQGIQLGANLDVTGMTHLHLDYWTENSNLLNVFLISPGPVETPVSLNVPTSGWGSIDIPLTDFSPVDLADLIQFKFDGNGDIWLDNLYFYKDGGGGTGKPTEAAPIPDEDPADVISVFSDSYTNIPGTDLNPNWGQSTVVTQEAIDGNNTLVYTGLNYQGIMLGSSTDVTGMTHLHLDVWTENSDALNVFLISTGPVETPQAIAVPTSGWLSLDIPLGDFSPVDLADIIQFKFDGNGDIYLDNIYFYKEGGGGTGMPAEAAPVPDEDPANVISVFSDSYMNLAGTNLNPNWGQATVVSEELIDGNNTLVYKGLNYQGIELGSNTDISAMTHLHLDVWTENSDALNVFLISPGPVETPKAITVPTSGWLSLDIPLGDFAPVDLADLIQFKFDGNGDIWLDNIYFYKESGGGPTRPTTAAPTPTLDPADVISVFSDAYMNIAGTDLNPNWGQATVVTQELIEGNNTLVYTGLNYQGIQLGSNTDVTGMTHVHLDVWTSNSDALNVFLISPGPVETAKAITVPTSGWLSLEIPLGDFTPVDLADIIQFKFDGNGDIFLDNIYFHK